MARNETTIAVPPERMWELLSDPYAYPRWVVGADRTVEADAAWPAPGSRFRVRLAIGLHDYTESRAVSAGKRIELDAGGILGPARVQIEIGPDGGGTRVTMVEDPAGKIAPLRFLPPVQLAIKARNVESLRRLRNLAEARNPS